MNSWSCEFKFSSTTCNWNQKWNNDKCQCECKRIAGVKKIIFGFLSNVFVRIVDI